MSTAHENRLAELKAKSELTETEKEEVRLIEKYLNGLKEPATEEAPKKEKPKKPAKSGKKSK